jgi:hypothetical protein
MISRSILAAGLLATSALALPPLTTIQDVLYKADGTRFNGSLTISWTSFEAIDRSAIAQQTTTVTVVNGYLRVQLVPTTTATPAAAYTVKYASDGKVQFTETWVVPSSAQPLRVRDVRVANAPMGTSAGSDSASVTVNESDVVGLISDLGARPLKGPGYAAGRVAWVNATGAIETVTGSVTDCVRVDGTSGPCGGAQPSFMDYDAPAGLVDGANTIFTLTGTPNPVGSLAVYRNGILMKAGQDFTLAGNSVQFDSGAVPQPGDTLLASYRLSTANTGTPQLYPYAEVICAGTGSSTNSTTLTGLGACTIPAQYLMSGDRVEVRFDVDHTGSAGGFSIELHWGGTTVLHRDGAAGDALATVRADAAMRSAGSQLSVQSWGTIQPFAAAVGTATDDFTAGITVDIQAKVAEAADTVGLRNYVVMRLP